MFGNRGSPLLRSGGGDCCHSSEGMSSVCGLSLVLECPQFFFPYTLDRAGGGGIGRMWYWPLRECDCSVHVFVNTLCCVGARKWNFGAGLVGIIVELIAGILSAIPRMVNCTQFLAVESLSPPGNCSLIDTVSSHYLLLFHAHSCLRVSLSLPSLPCNTRIPLDSFSPWWPCFSHTPPVSPILPPPLSLPLSPQNSQYSLTQGRTFGTIPELLQNYWQSDTLPRSEFHLTEPFYPDP